MVKLFEFFRGWFFFFEKHDLFSSGIRRLMRIRSKMVSQGFFGQNTLSTSSLQHSGPTVSGIRNASPVGFVSAARRTFPGRLTTSRLMGSFHGDTEEPARLSPCSSHLFQALLGSHPPCCGGTMQTEDECESCIEDCDGAGPRWGTP